jgi:hypothetical protein
MLEIFKSKKNPQIFSNLNWFRVKSTSTITSNVVVAYLC